MVRSAARRSVKSVLRSEGKVEEYSAGGSSMTSGQSRSSFDADNAREELLENNDD